MTTGLQDVLDKLATMTEKLERLSLEQKIGDPKREKEVDGLLRESRGAIQTVIESQRRQEDEARLSALLEAVEKNTAAFLGAMRESTAAAYDRLTASEERLRQLEKAEIERAGPLFERRDEIEAEGRYLAEALAGPPTDDQAPRYLKDARGEAIRAGIDVLGAAVVGASSTAKKTTQKEQ